MAPFYIPVVTSILVFSFLASSFPHYSEQHTIGSHQLTTTDTIRDILISSSVIDDVLDDFTPSYSVSVSYPSAHENVQLGNDIPVSAVDSRPTFEFHAFSPDKHADKNKTFTLVLTDPDAKSRAKPKMSEMCHWIMTNLTTPIPWSLDTFKAKEGELVEYLPPSPPPKTGKHRYVFVLLEGHTKHLTAPKERPHWGYGKIRHGVRDWAEENDLEVIGANFFYAANKKQ
jgi:phosphatidylethanolamine-binding protein